MWTWSGGQVYKSKCQNLISFFCIFFPFEEKHKKKRKKEPYVFYVLANYFKSYFFFFFSTNILVSIGKYFCQFDSVRKMKKALWNLHFFHCDMFKEDF